jgi:hypothetical protein
VTFLERILEDVGTTDVAWEGLRDSELWVASQLRIVTMQLLETPSMPFKAESDISDRSCMTLSWWLVTLIDGQHRELNLPWCKMLLGRRP